MKGGQRGRKEMGREAKKNGQRDRNESKTDVALFVAASGYGSTRVGYASSVRRPIRGLAVPSIPSIRTIRNTIMAVVE